MRHIYFLTLLAFPGLTGCATSGAMFSGHITNIELSRANFEVIATNVGGEAEAGYIFGISGAWGPSMQTFALVRIAGDGLLYQAALDSLWQSFQEDHGSVAGRRLALVNVRYDTEALNVLGLYTRPRVAIRADVVEFHE